MNIDFLQLYKVFDTLSVMLLINRLLMVYMRKLLAILSLVAFPRSLALSSLSPFFAIFLLSYLSLEERREEEASCDLGGLKSFAFCRFPLLLLLLVLPFFLSNSPAIERKKKKKL